MVDIASYRQDDSVFTRHGCLILLPHACEEEFPDWLRRYLTQSEHFAQITCVVEEHFPVHMRNIDNLILTDIRLDHPGNIAEVEETLVIALKVGFALAKLMQEGWQTALR